MWAKWAFLYLRTLWERHVQVSWRVSMAQMWAVRGDRWLKDNTTPESTNTYWLQPSLSWTRLQPVNRDFPLIRERGMVGID